MNVQITHVVVHTPEQVREIMREAQTIADEISDDPVSRDFLFGKACDLLAQRYTFAAGQQAMPLPAMAIPGLRSGH